MVETKTKLLYGELSYKLTRVLFDTHNELGRFAKEKQYASIIERKLKESKIPYKRELAIGDSGNIVDFLIDDKIILELKAKPYLVDSDYSQIKRYLHFCNLELGIVVNFREKIIKPKRVLNLWKNL